jgi:hypothetical protein
MSHVDKSKPIKGTAPSEDDEFYISWGRETLKNNINFLNEVLRQLVSLNVALLGGSIIFLDNRFVNDTFKALVMLAFLFSLMFSFAGIMPYGRSVDLRVAEDIRKHKRFVFSLKFYFTVMAGILLGAGFIVALVGLLVHKP